MAAKATKILDIGELKIARTTAFLMGVSPLVMNRFSKKAREELLLGTVRKNAAEKADTLKHDPVGEFRSSIYTNRDPKTPSFIHFPADAFKDAISNAAKDIPGATKAQIDRLVNVHSMQVNVFGVPQLYTTMVRSADINRTPDMRTRAIFPRWACKIDLSFVSTLLSDRQVLHLLAAAGMIVGLGDGRPERGKSYGRFELVNANDPVFVDLVKNEGRKAQQAAYNNPQCFDPETEELLAWFEKEVARREKTPRSKLTVVN